ncbi:MAG TPA: hypothetical protein VH575_10125, partial [Gemmataceae bacterium]
STTYVLTCGHVIKEAIDIWVLDKSAEVIKPSKEYAPTDLPDLAVLAVPVLRDRPPLPMRDAGQKGLPCDAIGLIRTDDRQSRPKTIPLILSKEGPITPERSAKSYKGWELNVRSDENSGAKDGSVALWLVNQRKKDRIWYKEVKTAKSGVTKLDFVEKGTAQPIQVTPPALSVNPFSESATGEKLKVHYFDGEEIELDIISGRIIPLFDKITLRNFTIDVVKRLDLNDKKVILTQECAHFFKKKQTAEEVLSKISSWLKTEKQKNEFQENKEKWLKQLKSLSPP